MNDRVSKDLFGLNCQVKYLSNSSIGVTGAAKSISDQEDFDNKLIDEAFERESLLYLIYINQSNEQFNSINLFVFNKWRLNVNSEEASLPKTCTIKG